MLYWVWTVELERIPPGELTKTDWAIDCILNCALLTNSSDAKEKVAPESNKTKASTKSTRSVPVTTSGRLTDPAVGMA